MKGIKIPQKPFVMFVIYIHRFTIHEIKSYAIFKLYRTNKALYTKTT